MRYLLFHTKSLQSGVYFVLKTHLGADQPHLRRLLSDDAWLARGCWTGQCSPHRTPQPLRLRDLGQVRFPVIRGKVPCALTVTMTFASSCGVERQSCGGCGGGGRWGAVTALGRHVRSSPWETPPFPELGRWSPTHP